MIDSVRAIETPEGVLLELRLAGPMVRALAWAIDMAIRFAFYMGLGMLLPLLGRAGIGLWLILMFLMEWFYPVINELQEIPHCGLVPADWSPIVAQHADAQSHLAHRLALGQHFEDDWVEPLHEEHQDQP